MPYIEPDDRMKFAELEQVLADADISGPGELNYVLTLVGLSYLEKKGPPEYRLINDVMGALTGAVSEFYRRVVAPYEDNKIAENGDVY